MGAVGNWEEEWSRSTWAAEEAEEVACGEGVRKRKRSEESTISFKQQEEEGDTEAIQQMKEIMYRAAAMRPVHHLAAESRPRRRRRNVRISTDPQTVAARQRRERISERLRLLQKLVPGGSKMDTATMLDEAANYLKFLRSQVTALQTMPPPPIPDFFTFATPPKPTT